MNKEGIIEVLRVKKSLYNLKNFILFGSFAKESSRDDSDIDIAYIEDDKKRLNYEHYLKLQSELESIFSTRVDLINYKKFNPLIKLHAKNEFIYV